MDFNELLVRLPEIKNKSLPGTIAHDKVLNTKKRDEIFKGIVHNSSPKQSAVLALIYPNEQGKAYMSFILRKQYDGHHSGQIALPGGKRESFDDNLLATALREANEEVNIYPDKVFVLKELTKVFIPVSNYNVYPYLAFSAETPDFKKDPSEVEAILNLPLSQILNNEFVPIEHNYFGKTYQLQAFQIDNNKIWGATAMILSEIKDLLNQVV